MDEGTIGRNATLMRDNVSHILTKCFPKFQEQSGQRVEFFPVEWRTNLRLDEGLVDAITPQRVMGLRFGSIPSVFSSQWLWFTITQHWTEHYYISNKLTEGINQSDRTLLNCTAMDIMYYTSPLFRMEIWSALQYELNRLYQMFTARNPTFEANGGKVSIVTHSLGNIST